MKYETKARPALFALRAATLLCLVLASKANAGPVVMSPAPGIAARAAISTATTATITASTAVAASSRPTFTPSAQYKVETSPPAHVPVKIPVVSGDCFVPYPETITYINLEAVEYFTVGDNRVIASFSMGRSENRLSKYYADDTDRIAVLKFMADSANACKRSRNPK